MTVGLEDIMEDSCLEKIADSAPKLAPRQQVTKIPFQMEDTARFTLPEPMFWLT